MFRFVRQDDREDTKMSTMSSTSVLLSDRGKIALHHEKCIEACFQSFGNSCQERKHQLQTMCAISPNAAIKSVMSSLGIDVTKPLTQIYAQCLDLPNYDDQPGIKTFAKEWHSYVQYLYGAKKNQDRAIGIAQIDPHWFDKQVGSITFDTALRCELWNNTERDASGFSLLTAGTLSNVKRPRLEDLLSADSHLLGAAGTMDEKRNAKEVIAEHVLLRKNIAKTRVYAEALSKWSVTNLQPLHDLHTTPLQLDQVKPTLTDASAAVDALRRLVEDQHTKWAQSHAQFGADLAGQSSDWVKLSSQHHDVHAKELEAKQKAHKDTLLKWLRLSLAAKLDGATLERCHRIIKACPDTTLLEYIQNDWPCTSSPAANKKQRMFETSRREEQKTTSEDMLGRIRQVLDNTSAVTTTLADWPDIVTRVMDVVRMCKVKDAGPEPIEQRQAMVNNAVQMDFGAYCREIAERVAIDPSVVLKPSTVRTPAIDAYHAWEKQMRDAVQRDQEWAYKLQQDILQALRECWQRCVYNPLCDQLQQLQDSAKQQARTIAVYAAWMDTVKLTDDQQARLAQATSGLSSAQGPPCPTTLSAALVQCTAWFEKIYRHVVQ
jgi:hypothetical protein